MPAKKGLKGYDANYDANQAFSGQKKKGLLQAKRAKKKGKADISGSEGESDDELWGDIKNKMESKKDVKKPVVVTSFGGSCDAEGTRLSSLFTRELDSVVAARRTYGEEPLRQTADKKSLVADEYAPLQSGRVDGSALAAGAPSSPAVGLFLQHPLRPKWHESMSTQRLEVQEEAYFKQWCEDTFEHIKLHAPAAGADVAPFELNLEVWRQLWRVVEQSDVVVLIVDVRSPTFHIPPSLVHDVTVTHKRQLVIALSKCDLVPRAFVQRWQRYLTGKLPHVGVVEFMSRAADDPPGGERGAGGIAARRRWLNRRSKQSDLEAHLNVMAKDIMRCAFDKQPELARIGRESEQCAAKATSSTNEQEAEPGLESGEEAGAAEFAEPKVTFDIDALDVKEEAKAEFAEPKAAFDIDALDVKVEGKPEFAEPKPAFDIDALDVKEEAKAATETQIMKGRGPGGALAIGLVGHPNVGKTSVLNALAGKKAASVSGTAGHTRHLQHIRVDESVHENAYVIDCPGLVFPSLQPRSQAELNGLLPLAQVRETMSGVRILAEALPLTSSLALKMPDWYDADEFNPTPQWTPLAIVEAYAEKHKYFIPRSGGPDVHRAGLEILKDAKDGAMLLAYEPPS